MQDRPSERADGHASQTALWAWKVAAAVGLFTSVGLWLRPAPADGAVDVAACSPSAGTVVGQPTRTPTLEGRSATVGLLHVSAELERARNSAERCEAMTRLARRRDLDAVAIHQIANYTGPTHPTHERHCAITALDTTNHSAALPTLIGLIDDQAPHIPYLALRALESSETQEARDTLLRVARGDAADLRVAALESLAARRDPETVTLVAGLLPSAEGERRHRFVAMLGTTRDPRAVGLLLELLNGPGDIQHAVVQALGTLGGRAAESTLIDVVHERPALASSALGALSMSDSEHARALLMEVAGGDGDYGEPLVSAALHALANQNAPEITALMLRTVTGENPQRANTAAQYLASNGVEAAVPVLLKFAQERGPHQVWPAVHALSQLGDSGRKGLEQLAGSSSTVALAAAQALNNMPGGREAARRIALTKLSQEKGPQAAHWVELLGDGSPEARDGLLRLARSDDQALSTRSLQILGRHGDPETLELMVTLAKTGKTEDQRAAALSSLQQSADPRAQAQVRAALKDPSARVRAQAVQGLSSQSAAEWEEGALAASRDTDLQVTQTATYALAQLGSQRAVVRLEELAATAKPGVSQTALSALLEHAPGRAEKIAEALASSREVEGVLTAVRTLGMLPKASSTRVLQTVLRQNNPDVLREALPVAGSLGLSTQELEALLGPVANNQTLPEDVRARVGEILGSSGELGMHLVSPCGMATR